MEALMAALAIAAAAAVTLTAAVAGRNASEANRTADLALEGANAAKQAAQEAFNHASASMHLRLRPLELALSDPERAGSAVRLRNFVDERTRVALVRVEDARRRRALAEKLRSGKATKDDLTAAANLIG